MVSFAQYKSDVLAEMRGFAAHVGVTGGNAATSITWVTNTNNSGAGSLRDACSAGNRWICFDPVVFPKTTEVTINLTSYIELRNAQSNITIDGFGSKVRITCTGGTGAFRTANWQLPPTGASDICNNMVFINLVITGVPLGSDNDCIQWNGSDRGWIYHCDLSDGGDGNLDIVNVHAGPNSPTNTGVTIQNCYIHDCKTSKNCLIGDQTEVGGSDYAQSSSNYLGGGNGGDCRITILDSRFKDRQRNPIVFNYHVHQFNNYYHGYNLEGPVVMGGTGHIRIENSVIDGSSGGANAFKGIYTWTFGYSDNTRKYKRWLNSGNVFLGGATQSDGSGGYLNPSGSIFTVPYSYTPETVTGDSGAALIARLASTSESTQGRSGRITRDGAAQLVNGDATVTPPSVAAVAAVPVPTVTASASFTPVVVAATAAVPGPSISATSGTTVVLAAPVAAVAMVNGTIVTQGSSVSVTPTVVAARAAVPAVVAATTEVHATVTPATVEARAGGLEVAVKARRHNVQPVRSTRWRRWWNWLDQGLWP